MDIMDSSDTPTGGLDGTTPSSSRDALPLSVDQRDDFSSSSTSPREAGSRATSTLTDSSYSSTSSAFDRLDAATGGDRVDDELPNGLPTSTDDVMMPTVSYVTHPSVLGDSTHSLTSSTASEKAGQLKDSAERAAADAKAKASSMADSAKSGAHSMADSAKSSAQSVMNSLSSSLHSAEDKASSAYNELKGEVKAHMPHGHTSTSSSSSSSSSTSTVSTSSTASTPAHTSEEPESTTTHPMASSFRDPHLHTHGVAVATHFNENPAPDNIPHVSAAHQRGLDAAAATDLSTEPKDASASTGVMGALSSLHSKLEEGADSLKDRVDAWADKNIRSDKTEGGQLSDEHVKNLPTLAYKENEKNNANVRAKMHTSSERGTASATQDDSI